jgi:hypothetical protein
VTDNKIEPPGRMFEDSLLRAVNDAMWRDFWRSLRPRPITSIINPELTRPDPAADTEGDANGKRP